MQTRISEQVILALIPSLRMQKERNFDLLSDSKIGSKKPLDSLYCDAFCLF